MSEDTSVIRYVSRVETAEELARRNGIDHLVNEVHEDHSQLPYLGCVTIYSADRRTGSISAVQERQILLEQFIRLPGNPRPDEVPARSPGEILVSFYNYELPLRGEPDDDGPGEAEQDAGEPEQDAARVPSQTPPANEASKKPICQPVPLQYLYNFPSNGAEMIDKADLLKLVPGNFVSGSKLRIMYVTSIQFVKSLYETMC